MNEENKPWARMRVHGPCAIFDWHASREQAEAAIQQSAEKNGEQVLKFQVTAYFPHKERMTE